MEVEFLLQGESTPPDTQEKLSVLTSSVQLPVPEASTLADCVRKTSSAFFTYHLDFRDFVKFLTTEGFERPQPSLVSHEDSLIAVRKAGLTESVRKVVFTAVKNL